MQREEKKQALHLSQGGTSHDSSHVPTSTLVKLESFLPPYLLPSGNGANFPGHLLTKPFMSEHGIRGAAAMSCP